MSAKTNWKLGRAGIMMMGLGCAITAMSVNSMAGQALAEQAGDPQVEFNLRDTNSAMDPSRVVSVSIRKRIGETLTAGTCNMPFSNFTGDTYIRVYGPNGSEVASNDDNCGGLGSYLSHVAETSGTYRIVIGCFGSTACSGVLSYE